MNQGFYKLSLAYGHRWWEWLFRLYPDDFAQTAALAALQATSMKDVGKITGREMYRLARMQGFRVCGNKWVGEDQFYDGLTGVMHGRMIWRTDPEDKPYEDPPPQSPRFERPTRAEVLQTVRQAFRLKHVQGLSKELRCKLLLKQR